MKIGRYEVVRPLGKGGMSEVYEVEDPVLGSRHALKAYTYAKDDPDVRRRFEVEGRLLAKLSHPRIVKVTDIGEDGGRPFFVMDLVLDAEGRNRSLADVPDGFADEETVGRWYDDVREALAYIHKQGVVHRDLKLQNVMVGPDGHAVLTDFGISKVFDAGDGAAPAVDAVNTIVHLRDGKTPVMGSVGYMAPELEMGAPASPQSDWYALGVIVYKLLTGTWCDARTDVISALETYDPVWLEIVPPLLHANPAGRECRSYAEAKAAARERAERDAERRFLREKARGHRARHVARYAALVALLASVAAVGLGVKHVRSRARLQGRLAAARTSLRAARARLALPTFESVFRIPGVAEGEAEGELSGSRIEYELAQVDAWVLTHRIFSDLAEGRVSLEDAVESMKAIQRKVLKGEEDDLWGDDYTGVGEEEVLRDLFKGAVKRMKGGGRSTDALDDAAEKPAAAMAVGPEEDVIEIETTEE